MEIESLGMRAFQLFRGSPRVLLGPAHVSGSRLEPFSRCEERKTREEGSKRDERETKRKPESRERMSFLKSLSVTLALQKHSLSLFFFT